MGYGVPCPDYKIRIFHWKMNSFKCPDWKVTIVISPFTCLLRKMLSLSPSTAQYLSTVFFLATDCIIKVNMQVCKMQHRQIFSSNSLHFVLLNFFVQSIYVIIIL